MANRVADRAIQIFGGRGYMRENVTERFYRADLYRTLVEQVPAVVYIDSNDQRPDSLYISPQAEEVFGYLPERFLADPELWDAAATSRTRSS